MVAPTNDSWADAPANDGSLAARSNGSANVGARSARRALRRTRLEPHAAPGLRAALRLARRHRLGAHQVCAGEFRERGTPMKCTTVRANLAGYMDDAITGAAQAP